MPSNVEIKARVSDIEALKAKALQISDGDAVVIRQEDTFFKVPEGRLKLRKLEGKRSQLIFYKRSDDTGPKFSDYDITETDEPDSLKQTLGKALGVRGIVKKERLLYMVGQTRVHVDHVEGLGDFMELEVVMKEGQTVEEGQAIAIQLMQQLNVKQEDLISCAYIDMILNKT